MVKADSLGGVAVAGRRGGGGHKLVDVGPFWRDGCVRLLRLSKGGDIGRESDQAIGLFSQHRDRLRVERLHAVLDCFQISLEDRDGRANLVREVAEHLFAGRFDVLQTAEPSD